MELANARPLVFALSGALLSAALLGCLTSVDGDRATTGTCPEGETCSTGDILGLRFIGQTFFDESDASRLGPIAVGGTFQLGLIGVGAPLDGYDVVLEEESSFLVTDAQGPFLPVDESGNSLVEVDGHLVLSGQSPALSYVRITDPVDGTLIDRLRIEVAEVDDVEFGLARDPEREFLLAGCAELVAVRLFSGDRRVFDQSLVITGEGQLLDEQMWDCISFEAPDGSTEASFEVFFANQSYAFAMPVLTLEEAGVLECPPVD